MPEPLRSQKRCRVLAAVSAGVEGAVPVFALTLKLPVPAVTFTSTGEKAPAVPTGYVNAPVPANALLRIELTCPFVRVIVAVGPSDSVPAPFTELAPRVTTPAVCSIRPELIVTLWPPSVRLPTVTADEISVGWLPEVGTDILLPERGMVALLQLAAVFQSVEVPPSQLPMML